MSKRPQSRVVRHSCVTLYEDKVTRKTSRLQADEEMILATARVERTLSSGEDSVTVELAGYSQRSSKPVLIPKFEINLSDPCWSHHIDEQGLKLTVSTTDANRREKEKYIFKMRSREQLASWAAEIIQATTFEPENTLQRCFHVIVPAHEGGSIQTPDYQRHAVLQVRHPNDSQLVVRDPLNLTDVRCWDLSQLEDFSFEFFPECRLSLQLYDEKSALPGKGDFIFFLSKEIVQQAMTFMQLFLENKLPRLYARIRRRDFQRETSQGTVTSAISYRVRSSSSVKRSQSVNVVDCLSLPHVTCRPSSDNVRPYAITQLFPNHESDMLSHLCISPRLVRYKPNPNPKPKPKPRPLSAVKHHSPPPKNLIRPGVVTTRDPADDYVEMAPVFSPMSPVGSTPVSTVECKVFSDNSDIEGYVNATEWVESTSEDDDRGLSTGSQDASNIDSGAKDYVNVSYQ